MTNDRASNLFLKIGPLDMKNNVDALDVNFWEMNLFRPSADALANLRPSR